MKRSKMPWLNYSNILQLVVCCLLMAYVESAGECSNPPPGVPMMVRGADITKLDLLPLSIIGSNGFMSPVINFTCSDRTWKSPTGTEYQLPDQVWHITPQPGGFLSAEVSLYKTYQDIRSSMTKEVGGEGSIWKFAFSVSRSYIKLQNEITNSSRYISDVSSFVSATRVDLFPSWVMELDRFASLFIDRMITGTFDSNPKAYNTFIEKFGTHYFTTGYFGGYIRMVYETSSSYFYSKTDNEVKTNAKASFLKYISASGGSVSASTNVDSKFTELSSQTVRYFGGDTNLLSQDGIGKWQPTVNTNPWLFSGSLRPISELIADETKRSSMERAVANHVMRSYLKELERLVNAAKLKISDPITSVLHSQIDVLKAKASLQESEVENLGRMVEEQLTVPVWFRTNTQLCYRWRADGDDEQCGGRTDGQLCAAVNKMTPQYLDDTDEKSGGCRMQWGIQSVGFSSWFSAVQVCYRWYADGDGGQCGGGAARELCANISGYTNEYRDDTNDRYGGCRMSWMLQVPSFAPLWIKTAKICFSWHPDVDRGQCGGPGLSRSFCAVANQWTEYYQDNTDNRGGGCRMSWGIKLDF